MTAVVDGSDLTTTKGVAFGAGMPPTMTRMKTRAVIPMMSSEYEEVVAVISKPPDERTEQEASKLVPWFRKKSQLFATLKLDVLIDIIRNCEFSSHQRDDVIIKQGERGDRYYIILRGRVAIFINNAISDGDDVGKSEDPDLVTGEEEVELDRSKYGNYISGINAGRSFGELALISEECVRNASIITDEATDLLVVDRALYNRSLRAAQAAEFQERTTFVAECPLFRGWARKYKRQMAMSIVRETINFDENIVRQGDNAGQLYFIVKGQAKIVIDPDQHRSQYPHLYPLTFDEDGAPCLETNKSNNSRANQGEKLGIAVMPSSIRRRDRKKRNFELCIIGSQDVIGDTELILDIKTYLQSVIATQTCIVYSLNTKNYERLVVRRNPKTVDKIQEHARLKLECRLMRLNENQVPLFRTLSHRIEQLSKPKQKQMTTNQLPEPFSSSAFPPRGAMIDQFGPGTVFHRIKERELARQKAVNKNQHFRGARGVFGLQTSYSAPSGVQTTANPHNVSYVIEEAIDENQVVTDELSDSRYDVMFSPLNISDPTHDRGGRRTMSSASVGLGTTIKPVDNNNFMDWRTSDKVLADLEDRIRKWHETAWSVEKERVSNPNTVQLKRLCIENGGSLKPAVKVVLRKRLPQLEANDDDVTAPENDVSKSEYSLDNPKTEGKTDLLCAIEEDAILGDTHLSNCVDHPMATQRPTKAQQVRRRYTVADYQDLRRTLLQRELRMPYLKQVS